MQRLIRFADLKALGIASSWMQVSRLIKEQGFPPGFRLTPRTRSWGEDDVQRWLDRRPSALDTPLLRGRAKALQDQARAKEQAKADAQVE